MQESRVAVGGGRFHVELVEQGEGEPLLFLHGISGLEWGDFLDRLAERHRVIAPRHPGFGDDAQEELDSVHDLVFAYLDLLDALGLRDLPLVGHSLGGMFAAELAATQPERFRRMVLLAPYGLFKVEEPVFDLFACTPKEQAEALFADPEAEAARQAGERGLRALASSEPGTPEHDQLIELYVERSKTLATAAKYLWPIPNRGTKKRLHRVAAPTLLVWGEQDGVVPRSYQHDWAELLPRAECATSPDAGHELLIEQPARTAEVVEQFLGATAR